MFCSVFETDTHPLRHHDVLVRDRQVLNHRYPACQFADRRITEPLFPEIGDENRTPDQGHCRDIWDRQLGVLRRRNSFFQGTSHQTVWQRRDQDFNVVHVFRIESMTFFQDQNGLRRAVGQAAAGKRLVGYLLHMPDAAQVGQYIRNVVLPFK